MRPGAWGVWGAAADRSFIRAHHGEVSLPGEHIPMARLTLLLRLVFIKFPASADEVQMWAAFQGEEKEEEEGKNRKFPGHELGAG